FLRRETKGASWVATKPWRRRVPASQRRPAISIELLMLMGTPWSGPRALRDRTAASAARAVVRARSASGCTTAFSWAFRLAIVFRLWSVGETLLWLDCPIATGR